MFPSLERPPGTRAAAPPRGPGLPLELTRFIGREREVPQIRALLGDRRLVTLTGAGGTGKTRLALEVARGAAWPTAFVEMAAVSDATLLPARLARALGVAEELSDLESLVGRIPDEPLLLVLDNCEHLVEGCAALAEQLLARRPALRILATSREALSIPGERVWLVSPLPHVGPDSEAVDLFLDRARDVAPGFDPTSFDADTVEEICRRLEGIPLALELAAARLRVLTPAQLLERLDDMPSVLSAGRRTTHPRHKTLRAAIAWSSDHLEPGIRELFRRLSVFRGGFTLEAVETLVSGDPSAPDALDAMTRLVDRSLAYLREGGRYAMLEPVRQFAADELARHPEEEAEARTRHAQAILGILRTAEPHFLEPDRRTWAGRVASELDNLRAALAHTRTSDPALHVELASTAWWLWFSTRHWTEARSWLEAALHVASDTVPPHAVGRLSFALGALDALQARPGPAAERLQMAVRIAEDEGDARARAYALNYLGMAYAQERRPEAEAILEEARAWHTRHQDLYGLRLSLLLLATAQQATGRLDEAIATATEGVEIARIFGLDRELAIALQTLGVLHLRRGELDRAEALLLESLSALRRDPAHMFLARAVQFLGVIRARQEKAGEAGRWMGMAETLRERLGAPPFELDRSIIDAEVERLRASPGRAAFDAARDAGRREDAVVAVEALFDSGGVGTDPCAEERASDRTPTGVAEAMPGEEPVTGVTGAAPGRGLEPAGEPMPGLDVRALGPMEVRLDGRVLPDDAWPYAKPRELLLYLVAHRSGRTRDDIAAALWPDSEAGRLKNSFHVTLHHLRRALGDPGWVVIDRDRYRLDPDRPVRFDLDRFEAAVRDLPDGPASPEAGAACRRALSLYRGPFYPEGSGERWFELIRDRARRAHADVALRLGDFLERRGEDEEAIEVYRALVRSDELDEEGRRGLMRALARTGRRAEALREFERLQALLERELQAEPESATLALRDEIRQGRAPAI